MPFKNHYGNSTSRPINLDLTMTHQERVIS